MENGVPLDPSAYPSFQNNSKTLVDYTAHALNGVIAASQYGQPAGRIIIRNAVSVPDPSQQENGPELSMQQEISHYTVLCGDSLWKISYEKLGNGRRWTEIYALNQSRIGNSDFFYTGQILEFPAS